MSGKSWERTLRLDMTSCSRDSVVAGSREGEVADLGGRESYITSFSSATESCGIEAGGSRVTQGEGSSVDVGGHRSVPSVRWIVAEISWGGRREKVGRPALRFSMVPRYL